MTLNMFDKKHNQVHNNMSAAQSIMDLGTINEEDIIADDISLLFQPVLPNYLLIIETIDAIFDLDSHPCEFLNELKETKQIINECIGVKLLKYRSLKQKGDNNGNKYLSNIDFIKDQITLLLTIECEGRRPHIQHNRHEKTKDLYDKHRKKSTIFRNKKNTTTK